MDANPMELTSAKEPHEAEEPMTSETPFPRLQEEMDTMDNMNALERKYVAWMSKGELVEEIETLEFIQERVRVQPPVFARRNR